MEPRIQYAKTVDGVSIVYCVAGEGETLVHIVGWQYSIRIWGVHALNRPCAWPRSQTTDPRAAVSEPLRDRQMLDLLPIDPSFPCVRQTAVSDAVSARNIGPPVLWEPRTSSESDWMSTASVRASLTCRV